MSGRVHITDPLILGLGAIFPLYQRLSAAIYRDDARVVRDVFRYPDVDPNCPPIPLDKDTMSILSMTARKGSSYPIAVAIAQSANVGDNSSALHLAGEARSIGVVRELLCCPMVDPNRLDRLLLLPALITSPHMQFQLEKSVKLPMGRHCDSLKSELGHFEMQIAPKPWVYRLLTVVKKCSSPLN